MSRWVAGVVLLVCSVPTAVGQGKLGGTRREAQPPPANRASGDKPPEPDRPEANSGWTTDEDESMLGVLVLGAIAVTSPFWYPPLVLDSDEDRDLPSLFPAHPYARDKPSYITKRREDDDGERTIFDPQYLKPWAVRASLEDGHDFGRVNRLGGRFAVDTGWRFGLTTNWDFFRETLPNGRGDEAVLGDVNLTYRLAQNDWLQLHTGLGARLLFDRHNTRAGLNFLYGADLFLAKPLVLSGLVDLGTLNHAYVVRARATLGWQVGRCEVFGGYDVLRVGDVHLHGPLLGLRVWF